MQSIQFVRNLQEITNHLKIQELIKGISPLINVSVNEPISEATRTLLADLIFEAREGFNHVTQQPDVKSIAETLGVASVFNAKTLSIMLTILNTQNETAGIYGNANHFTVFQTFYSNLLVMQAFQTTLQQHLAKQKTNTQNDTERIIEFEILDYDGNGLPLGRLAMILEEIQKLHNLIAKVIDDKTARLTINYMDSGSDFLIGVQSSFKVIELLKTLCFQFWQKIRFRTSEEFERNIEALGKGINLIQHISRQEKNGAFDNETATRLKASALDGITALIGLGVTLKEYEFEEKFDRRKLLADKKDLRLNISSVK